MTEFHVGNRVMVTNLNSGLWGEFGYITQVDGGLVAVQLNNFRGYGDMAFSRHELELA